MKIPMNIEEMNIDESTFAEGSHNGFRRRAWRISMGNEQLCRLMNAYVVGNPIITKPNISG